jgi:putative endonuclease
MTNKNNTVLYTGITNNLKRRVYEHKEKVVHGFTKKYNVTKLVFYEVLYDPENAILREKQIKGGSRQKKIHLIESVNKEWKDLYEKI